MTSDTFLPKAASVEAIRFTGGNAGEVVKWVALKSCSVGDRFHHRVIQDVGHTMELHVKLMEGDLKLREGDWLVKTPSGELYAVEPDAFETNYVHIEERKAG